MWGCGEVYREVGKKRRGDRREAQSAGEMAGVNRGGAVGRVDRSQLLWHVPQNRSAVEMRGMGGVAQEQDWAWPVQTQEMVQYLGLYREGGQGTQRLVGSILTRGGGGGVGRDPNELRL